MIRSQAPSDLHVWAWVAFVTIASLLLSRAFACATPFAALAALAALTLRDRDGIALVLAGWLGNQLVGFGLMHYPWTTSTFGWGLAIGTAAVAAWAAARGLVRLLSLPLGIAAGLIGAYVAYELALLAATTVLPTGPGVFAAAVVMRIFAINVVVLALLLAAQRVAGFVGLRAGRVPALLSA